jgi:hypothetical protein
MPLRVTIELIPHGDESRTQKLAMVDIENDCTAGDARGSGGSGKYRVHAQGQLQGIGWDDFADVTIGPLLRGNHLDTAIECLAALHSKRTPLESQQREDEV